MRYLLLLGLLTACAPPGYHYEPGDFVTLTPNVRHFATAATRPDPPPSPTPAQEAVSRCISHYALYGPPDVVQNEVGWLYYQCGQEVASGASY